MAHAWFEDRSATMQSDLRFIYLGLQSKSGVYMWENGAQLRYTAAVVNGSNNVLIKSEL